MKCVLLFFVGCEYAERVRGCDNDSVSDGVSVIVVSSGKTTYMYPFLIRILG